MASAPSSQVIDSDLLQRELRRSLLDNIHALTEQRRTLGCPSLTGIVVGFSGGLDSSLLLRLACDLRDSGELSLPLRALHVDHGIASAAPKWRAHCVSLGAEWGVEVQVVEADVARPSAGVASEGAARSARYEAFSASLVAQECLLLAHHQDDQLETLLLRLARGSGVEGLAGMPASRDLAAGTLLRPWLRHTRLELEAVAGACSLHYVTDPSNAQTDYDRNLLRAAVLPEIETRWPQYRKSWGKSLQLLGEANTLVGELADSDIHACRVGGTGRLALSRLISLSSMRRRNVLKRWFARLGLPAPSWNFLTRLDVEIAVTSAVGETSRWQGEGCTVFRYLGELIAVIENHAACSEDVLWSINESEGRAAREACRGNEVCELPANGRLLLSHWVTSEGAVDGVLRVSTRRGGESIKLVGRRTKSLKKALNEARVAPWLRDLVPLIYCNDELIWVAQLGFTHGFSQGGAQALGLSPQAAAKLSFEWIPPRGELPL